MTVLTRREALRSICTAAAAGAAVAVPVAIAAASEADPAVPPGRVQPQMARREMIDGYIIDRDPAKLVVGATVMWQAGNGELAVGTIAEWLDGHNERDKKHRWRVHVDYPEMTRQRGYRCVIGADAIGVVESGPAPRAGWDKFKRVFDHRLA
jgi:hypothetical protein